jgi:hypothetical protein
MSESVMTAPVQRRVMNRESSPQSFQQLQEQIKAALSSYKQRQAAVASIREA